MAPETALQALKRCIEEEHSSMRPPRQVWFWLTGHALASRGRPWTSAEQVAAVKGFLGTAPVIFAGLNPSLRNGPQTPYDPDEFFYRALAEYNLHDAHVTDLFKVRCGRKDVSLVLYTPPLLTLHRDRFAEEARIIQPIVVVAMGAEVLNVLLTRWHVARAVGVEQYEFLVPAGGSVPLVATVHPAATSYPKTRAERQMKFRQACAKVRELLERGA